ncbi:MAG TPA: preprotein translocase subunit SecG [Gemmatimonadaceae bacterium]|nr:preprotein translocase subunit SecG [Gemmatimonadaceae bacterium]
MFTFFLVLLVLDSLVLIAVVLMQEGKGGGLAASFGGAGSSAGSFLGTRQMGNVLTKASWWTGGIFLVLSFILASVSQRGAIPRSPLDQPLTPPAQQSAPAAPAPALPLQPAPGGQTPAQQQQQPPAQGSSPSSQP